MLKDEVPLAKSVDRRSLPDNITIDNIQFLYKVKELRTMFLILQILASIMCSFHVY